MRLSLLLSVALLATVARADDIPGYVTSKLGSIDAAIYFEFVDINEKGWVLGYACYEDCEGVLWGAQEEAIYMPWGIGGTQVLDLNNVGEVLAEASPDLGFWPAPWYAIFNPAPGKKSGPCDELGVICTANGSSWEPVVVVEKDGKVVEDWSLWHGDGTQAVNKRGQFVRMCWPCEGDPYVAGFLYTPEVPEPSTLVLLATALGVALLVARSRRMA